MNNNNIEIYSYEPIPDIYKKNISFHQINGLSTAGIINAAIGENDGEAEIYLPIIDESVDEQTTATLRKDSWQFSKKHEIYKVNTIKLDNVLKGRTPDDKVFIKIDVEDYESGVFKGAIETLRTTKPIIVCEILPREHGNQETIEILIQSDYVAFGISAEGLIRFNIENFYGPRNFTDFLLLPVSLAPKLNYISYSNMDSIDW